jgi:ribose transport system permease protein
MVSVQLVNAGVPLEVAIASAVALGALIGVINGVMVAIVGINTVIATLGTLYITAGATLVLGEGMSVRPDDPGYRFIGNGEIGPVPVLVIIMLAALVFTLLIERRTRLGRYAVLVGGNPKGARLNGLPVRTTQVTLFIMTAAAAGFAGVMVASRHNAALPGAGVGFEFSVIIATLLGGTSLLGGQGSVIGLLLGALIVGALTTGLNILGIESFIQTVVLGVVLIAAVGFDAVVRGRRGRPTRRVLLKEAEG